MDWLGPGTLAQARVPPDELHMGTVYESNAFTFVEVPEAWRRMQ